MVDSYKTGRNSKSKWHGVCLVCRVYVTLLCMPDEGMRPKQRKSSADEILTHGHEWHLEELCDGTQRLPKQVYDVR